ncbi:zinc finger Y-chromosomal protein 2-like isoform X15 [Sitophilus oryzae]|uniref:Zinc finger Y-chromosomal protein 2-like isoform X15 n=1 Tax=Sitophilus oryzae TaxID=7048 RepID=A0A6J2XMP1_SITOR|nr:zinc finger Y-chromosomal protein 2-like isoform X15 [Sitophilus oryzae]
MDNPGEIMRFCRLCLVKDQVNIPIFEEQGDIRQIFLKISSCLPVKVSREDKLPKKICDGCSNKLDLLYEFWNTSANAEKTLLSWLGQAGVKDVDQTITAVAQQIAKPSEPQVKEETPEDGHAAVQNTDHLGISNSAVLDDSSAKDETEEPPPKRARRTAAVKAQINLTPDSEEEDDDLDTAEPMTKIEDESDESDNDDKDPSYVDVPGTSADDQPGPSGVGKDGAEAPVDEIFDIDGSLSDDQSINQYECGICGKLFDSKRSFIKNHINKYAKRLTCYEEDQNCVNEVVIQDNEPEQLSKKVRPVDLVALEHGYMLPELPPITKVVKKTVLIPIKNPAAILAANKPLNSVPKPPRARQPKKRHEVPNFSATGYILVEANDGLDTIHYKCERCEQIFINKFGFFRHIEKGKCYINNCDVCMATFSKNGEFYTHYIEQHTDRAICNFCFRTFMYEKNVKEHMLRHLDQFRHRCEDCSKGFYTVREYRNHYKNRHMGIRHKCEICDRSFADEYYFKKHFATHSHNPDSVDVSKLENFE